MVRASLIFLLLFFGTSSFASMYFEPVVGYGQGSSSISGTTDNSYSTYSSPSVGFKFGYFVEYVYLVTDLRYTIVNLMELPTESSPAQTSFGVGIGWDWNIPIRTYFGMDLRVNSNLFDVSFSGGGSRIAVGYYLNLDTLMSIEFISHKLTAEVGSVDFDLNLTSTMITFSFPIEFIYPQTTWKDKVR